MIIKQKPVYYCEHCKIYRLAKWAMEKHEKGCTLNPKRDCNMCQYGDDGIAFEDLLAKFPVTPDPGYDDEGYAQGRWQDDRARVFKEVQAETICPACRLAWIRQNGFSNDYNFDKDKTEFWAAHNASLPDTGVYGFD